MANLGIMLKRNPIIYINYAYYCGQESLRRNGVSLLVNKSPNAILGCNLKNYRMISVRFQGKPFNITVMQVYALTWKSWRTPTGLVPNKILALSRGKKGGSKGDFDL